MEGKTPAAAMRGEIKQRAATLARSGHQARLAAVLVGHDKASDLYLRRKAKLGRELGIAVDEHRLPDATQAQVTGLLQELSCSADVDGILLEQPLPQHMDKLAVLHAITPSKDVDGSTGRTHGLLTGDRSGLAPATPLAVMRLLHHYGVPLTGADVVIVGHSPVVGKPLALMMLREDATVSVCHKETKDLTKYTNHADILVVAAGVPGLIQGEMLKQGAVVVDVGINVVNGKTVGDVDFDSARYVAGAITPVPGGVGPLTTLTILENTLKSAERRRGLSESAAD